MGDKNGRKGHQHIKVVLLTIRHQNLKASSVKARKRKSNFYDLFFTTPVYDLAFFKKHDAAFSKGFTTTLQVNFYDQGITPLVNDLTLA